MHPRDVQARLVLGIPPIVMSRISSLVFDRNEELKRATIITPLGSIKVEWRKVGGDRHWISSGDLAARLLAVPVIQRIERMVQPP